MAVGDSESKSESSASSATQGVEQALQVDSLVDGEGLNLTIGGAGSGQAINVSGKSLLGSNRSSADGSIAVKSGTQDLFKSSIGSSKGGGGGGGLLGSSGGGGGSGTGGAASGQADATGLGGVSVDSLSPVTQSGGVLNQQVTNLSIDRVDDEILVAAKSALEQAGLIAGDALKDVNRLIETVASETGASFSQLVDGAGELGDRAFRAAEVLAMESGEQTAEVLALAEQVVTQQGSNEARLNKFLTDTVAAITDFGTSVLGGFAATQAQTVSAFQNAASAGAAAGQGEPIVVVPEEGGFSPQLAIGGGLVAAAALFFTARAIR